jgi:hypothetical protein
MRRWRSINAITKTIISPDIIDVALSYSIAGIEVVLEIPFENRAEFENSIAQH